MFRRTLLFAATLTPLFAEEGAFDFKGELTKMFFSLIIIIALLLVGVWWFKRSSKSRLFRLNLNTQMKILERRPLSAKASLYLVEVCGKRIVVGESPAGVAPITELPPVGEDSHPFAKVLATKNTE